MSGAEIVRVAERALLVRFHDDALELAVAKAQVLCLEAKGERLSLKGKDEKDGRSEKPPLKGEDEQAERVLTSANDRGEPALRRIVLGAGSVLVEVDERTESRHFEQIRARLTGMVREIEVRQELQAAVAGLEHRIAVSFGGEEGPDLESVAREAGLSPEGVVERLCGAELRVAFVGFAPGFPYLIGLPRELERPRLASPRARVPAGSVAIAGPFAGIYPSVTPGGWRLLGRLAASEAALFDSRRDPPARFAAGDRVRFVRYRHQQQQGPASG